VSIARKEMIARLLEEKKAGTCCREMSGMAVFFSWNRPQKRTDGSFVTIKP